MSATRIVLRPSARLAEATPVASSANHVALPAATPITSSAAPPAVPAAAAAGRMTLPFAPELRPHPQMTAGAVAEGPALLGATAARTGGRVVNDVRELYDTGADRRETRQRLRTPVLLATALLFLVDVFLRRVRLRAD